MSSIGNVSSLIASSYSGIGSARHQRPDPAEMAEDLFSRLDTTGKGYIEQSDLESALSGLTTSSSSLSSASASEIFSQLDGDGDGKITQDEMSSGISKLAQALDDQFNQSRMQGGMPPPPPPPRGGDSGFTKDELSSKLSEVGISVPIGLAAEDDLPVGLQVLAPAMADERLYTVAAAVEAALERTWGEPLWARVPAMPAQTPAKEA